MIIRKKTEYSNFQVEILLSEQISSLNVVVLPDLQSVSRVRRATGCEYANYNKR